jgi:hypothetical protein
VHLLGATPLHVVPYAIRTLGIKGRGTKENGEDHQVQGIFQCEGAEIYGTVDDLYLARNDLELEGMARNEVLACSICLPHISTRIIEI